MEWLILSLAIVGAALGAAGGVVYYYHQFYDSYIQARLLHEKRLAICEEITGLVGKVKASLEYTSGDETLSEWKRTLLEYLREILGRSYQWSIFLPADVSQLPSQYAGKLALHLNSIDHVDLDDLSAVADAIAEMKRMENEAARDLQHKIRQVIGNQS